MNQFMDLDQTRRMQSALATDRQMAFGIMSRPFGLRAAMMECYERGAEELEDKSYEITAHGGSVYGFWIQDLANSLNAEASRL